MFSKNIISGIAAAAIVSVVGLAYAQTTAAPDAPGQGNSTQTTPSTSSPTLMTPSTTTTTPTMPSNSPTMSTTDVSTERAPQADRN